MGNIFKTFLNSKLKPSNYNYNKVKNILILCPYPQGIAAGQRFKYEQYFSSWEEYGYNIEVSSFFDLKTWDVLYEESNYFLKTIGTLKGYLRRIRDIFVLRNYEIVYIFMWVTPLGSTLFERLVRKFSGNLVYDFDDAIFLDNTDKFNSTNVTDKFYSTNVNLVRNSSKKKSRFLISSSDHVILSSPFHLDYCKQLNINHSVTYIPCSIDTNRLTTKKTDDTNKKIVLGWTGTFSSIILLDLLRDILIELNKTEQFKVLLITNFDYSFPGIDMDIIRWDKESEVEDLHKIDIGLYPLSRNKWALGKGGLKVLQYMSIGIPSVATNFGTAIHIMENGETGFLVDGKDEWISILKKLINNKELRVRIGKNARDQVVKNYSVEKIQSKYLEVLDSLSMG